MTDDVAVVTRESVEGLILVIRGEKVILDRDLAVLYGVETRVLIQAVKRNVERSRWTSCSNSVVRSPVS